MSHFNEQQLRELFQESSPDFIRINSDKSGQAALLDNDSRKASKPQRIVRDGAVGEVSVQGQGPARILVKVTSVRKQWIDDDNLCAKYHVDCLRYAGLIPNDKAPRTRIEIRQEKVEPGCQEEVRIEVYEI